jgi:sugar lactone lactonase YvrE
MLASVAGTVRRIGGTVDLLGESPIWSEREQALYWIDIRGRLVRRLDTDSGEVDGELDSWPMPELAGSLALRPDGNILVALASQIALFRPARGSLETIAAPHKGEDGMRFNDGRCDREGRFWVGSMHDIDRRPTGTLYRLDARGCVPMLGGVAVPNSLAWSPDGRIMYFSDGVEPVIWSFPFSMDGELGPRREFARLDAGLPDGATVDADGCVWSAHYGGGRITRYRPDGSIERVVEMPVSQPTCLAFGGPDLATLYITSAAQNLSAEERASQPLAGAMLALEPGVHGLPEPFFLG